MQLPSETIFKIVQNGRVHSASEITRNINVELAKSEIELIINQYSGMTDYEAVAKHHNLLNDLSSKEKQWEEEKKLFSKREKKYQLKHCPEKYLYDVIRELPASHKAQLAKNIYESEREGFCEFKLSIRDLAELLQTSKSNIQRNIKKKL